jgi:hypothetical protein
VSVDALEAVLAHARADDGIMAQVDGRLAVQHRYGQDADDWPLDAKSLILRPAAGLPQLYLASSRHQLEGRCYGRTGLQAWEVWQEVDAWLDSTTKATAETEQGTALIYYVIPVSQPTLLMDEELERPMPFYSIFLEADVAKETVTV